MINTKLSWLKWPYLIPDEIKLLDKYERWRKVANILKISKNAKNRLEWIIYYYTKADMNASLTCRHFGMRRKTFYKWFNQFDEDNLYTLHLLEDKSRAPKHVRQTEITPLQEERLIILRKRYPRYGKIKLSKIYEREYKQYISSWKVQKTITKYHLYYNPKKTAKTARKRVKTRARGRKRKTVELMHHLPSWKKRASYIICFDSITIYWNGLKRYIFTAIDKFGKVGYARMYKTKSSLNEKDFLYRMYYLMDGHLPKVAHDNGSEFKKYFEQFCQELKIKQYYSSPRTPKDNPECERFNQTLENEFLSLGNFAPEPDIFNQKLAEWLIEYNFRRPHETLNHQTPLEYSKVLPMYSSWAGT